VWEPYYGIGNSFVIKRKKLRPPHPRTTIVLYTCRSILPGRPPSPKDSPPLFHAKKLAGYAPSIVSTLGVIGKACSLEAAYRMYRTFVDAFGYSTKAGETVFAQSEEFDNVYLSKIILPFLPEVSFSPTKALTVDQATALLQTLPKGSSMKAIGRTFEFAVPSPSISLMPKFLAADSPTHGSPRS